MQLYFSTVWNVFDFFQRIWNQVGSVYCHSQRNQKSILKAWNRVWLSIMGSSWPIHSKPTSPSESWPIPTQNARALWISNTPLKLSQLELLTKTALATFESPGVLNPIDNWRYQKGENNPRRVNPQMDYFDIWVKGGGFYLPSSAFQT